MRVEAYFGTGENIAAVIKEDAERWNMRVANLALAGPKYTAGEEYTAIVVFEDTLQSVVVAAEPAPRRRPPRRSLREAPPEEEDE